MCPHTPTCPSIDDPEYAHARLLVDHEADQGWILLCNGVIRFHDGECIVPAA